MAWDILRPFIVSSGIIGTIIFIIFYQTNSWGSIKILWNRLNVLGKFLFSIVFLLPIVGIIVSFVGIGMWRFINSQSFEKAVLKKEGKD